MQQDFAEARALTVLAWLAGDEDLLPVFMNATGTSEADMRLRAGDPDFLAAMMEFLLMDDRWVLDASAATGIPAQDFAMIRAALPGGHLPNWT
ncbi:DUF3572 domain-containing protein [Hasllibacter sp. MH4015]|uniref:DUF3572 domain-containing protein n=1 Tax=Hasllibacter sp. MH4015 TaxID=2854029 RepID=UPI001CD489DA|nr:DUF3572 domain-containing protein [Hasllibacter sp. MH4015]